MIRFILFFIFLLFSIESFTKQPDFVLVIDPGHGGKDPGALGSSKKFLNEKDIVLEISLKLKSLILENIRNVSVFLTRDKDEFIPLDKRSELANKLKANLFISIHCNSRFNRNSVTRQYGAETYVMGIHKNEENLEVAKKENSVITLEENYNTKYQGFDPNSPESIIGMTFLQSAFLDNSLHFSSYIQSEFEKIGRKDNGVKQAGFYVISFNSMPSVLIEIGYISDKEEEKFLNSDIGKRQITYSIFKAFKEYKKKFDEKRTNENNIIKDISKQDITYRLQIMATSKKVNKSNKIFKDFETIEEYKDGNIFKYIVGNEKEPDDIFKLKEIIESKGYKNPFIVIFRNGKKLNREESKQYLDL